jgi:outer membrane protein TolC
LPASSVVASAPEKLSDPDGSLNAYLAVALEKSPEARAAFQRWRSAMFSVSRKRRLPEPSLSFGYYLRSVETKAGPQRFNLGVSQTFPWPTKLSAGADAASEKARAAGLMFDAQVLGIRREVAKAYWTLWLIHEEHRLKSEHDVVLEALAGAVRGRLQIGAATLADLNQVDLGIARHHDHRGRHAEAALQASVKLRAVLGVAPDSKPLPATDQPRAGLPRHSEAELAALGSRHPMIEQFTHLAASEDHRARAEGADRYPRFKLGVNLIETGPSAGAADSGKDALIVSAGLSIPLWGNYSDQVDAARAASSAHRAEQEASRRKSEAGLGSLLSRLRDAQRRVHLYKRTLVPQAETTFQAVLGGYQSGGSTVASVILAQRDLIELQLQRAAAQAEHARTWAELEFLVGREVEAVDSDVLAEGEE